MYPTVQGAMGNIMQDAGATVHGALYRLQPVDLARLTNMEHEYRREAQSCQRSLLASIGRPTAAKLWALHACSATPAYTHCTHLRS